MDSIMTRLARVEEEVKSIQTQVGTPSMSMTGNDALPNHLSEPSPDSALGDFLFDLSGCVTSVLERNHIHARCGEKDFSESNTLFPVTVRSIGRRCSLRTFRQFATFCRNREENALCPSPSQYEVFSTNHVPDCPLSISFATYGSCLLAYLLTVI